MCWEAQFFSPAKEQAKEIANVLAGQTTRQEAIEEEKARQREDGGLRSS